MMNCIIVQGDHMKLKTSIQIIIKLSIIMALLWYLPTYTLSSAKVFKAIEVPKPAQPVQKLISQKKIHIYNTHQGEKYQGYSVIDGAKHLSNLLNKMGYSCDVENNDFENYKAVHKIAYDRSYLVSKLYLENAIQSHGHYDLVIDFHRDSIPKNYSTLTLNNHAYAKILFVVGKSSGKFEAVQALSQQLSNRANHYANGISKGIMVKQNHYNQGICDHTVLIEFGAQDNTKEEVQATIEIVAQTIRDYLQ